MTRFFFTLLLFIQITSLHANTIGTWKAFMAYNDITDVQQGENILYVLASNALYTYNKNDMSIQTYDKTNGLNDCEIAFIRWNQSVKKLIIVYSNGNIDLLDSNGNVTNISDYYSKTLTEDKTINSTYTCQQYVYLCTGFGIVKVDADKEIISETYNLGLNISYTWQEGRYIYASSLSSDITYRAAFSDNLLDKNSWTRVGGYIDKSETIDADLLAVAKTLSPGGPKYNHFGYMRFKNNKLYTVSGGFSQLTDYSYPGSVQVLSGDGNWTIFEDEDFVDKTGHLYCSTSAVDVCPTNENITAVGARTGLYLFNNGKLQKCYASDNSIITDAVNVNYTLILGLAYDKEGNLWFANSQSPNTSLFCLTTDGQLSSHHSTQLMYNNISLAHMRDLKFDSRNLLWFVNNHTWQPSLVCYQPLTESLVVYKTFVNEDGTTLTPYYVRCVTEDRDGNMWIGTSVGPLMLEANNIGENPNDVCFNQVKVQRNDGTNYADYLLSGIDINCIAVDGAGRKWLGTNGNGVYLISEDNDTQVHHFLSNNSPLLSDNIESIAINGTTGEVFFGTDKGLCSYMSDATTPSEEMTTDNVWAYPNPVRPDYTGLITITNLSYNADIKIVSSNGVLVNQGRSNGGTYTWDGKDKKGKRVASGVYMVEIATSDGSKGTVCKIAIVR